MYSFEEIKNLVLSWICSIIDNPSAGRQARLRGYEIELTKVLEDVVIVDFTFENCLAQLTLSEPDFAPYKNIFFEAMAWGSKTALETGQPELICFFYDSPDTTAADAISGLAECIKFCLDYKQVG